MRAVPKLFHLNTRGTGTHITTLASLIHQINTTSKNVPILGVDVGTKHMGLSLSDPLHKIAFPLSSYVSQTPQRDMSSIKSVLHSRHVGVNCAIVGMPVAPPGKNCDGLRTFIEAYAATVLGGVGISAVAFWDETYSTALATEAFKNVAKTSQRRDHRFKKKAVDVGAATVILQDVLDLIQSIPQPD